MESKKSLIVDMDDVIVICKFQEWLEEFIGYKLELSEKKEFCLQNILPPEQKKKFFENWGEKNLYGPGAILIPGCYEALEKLSQIYEIYICTDFIWKEAVEDAGSNAKNKYDYLREKLPFISPWHYIFTGDKSVVHGDIKVDDRPVNLKNADMKLLFTAYHNINLTDEELARDGMIRVNDWNEVLNLLL